MLTFTQDFIYELAPDREGTRLGFDQFLAVLIDEGTSKVLRIDKKRKRSLHSSSNGRAKIAKTYLVVEHNVASRHEDDHG
jgi:hypothetical protein